MPSATHSGMNCTLRPSGGVTSALSRSLLLSAVAASAALAGCGGAAAPATRSIHGRTILPTNTSPGRSARGATEQRQSLAKPLTLEEMREYDANEGRCDDDGGRVRDVGTVDAYCAFPARSNDFHLIESTLGRKPSGEEE
jgi:hypothetical protein